MTLTGAAETWSLTLIHFQIRSLFLCFSHHVSQTDAAQTEIIEMLTQQGLAEISDATQSEQIAYLLVERARLLDELEESNNNNNSSSNNASSTNISPDTDGRQSETELKQILEQVSSDKRTSSYFPKRQPK